MYLQNKHASGLQVDIHRYRYQWRSRGAKERISIHFAAEI